MKNYTATETEMLISACNKAGSIGQAITAIEATGIVRTRAFFMTDNHGDLEIGQLYIDNQNTDIFVVADDDTLLYLGDIESKAFKIYDDIVQERDWV